MTEEKQVNSIQEHMAGTARLAAFHAERALTALDSLVRRIESGRAYATDYTEIGKAINEAQSLVRFLVRLEHASMVRDHIGRSDELLMKVAASNRIERKSDGSKGPAIKQKSISLKIEKTLIDKVDAHLCTFTVQP